MIIQKIYSEIEQGEEKIYSVLMTEEEMRFYSNKSAMSKKEFDEAVKKNRINTAKEVGHAAASLIDSGIAYHFGKDLIKNKSKSKISALGVATGATGAIYHGAKTIKNHKEADKRCNDPRYLRALKREILKQDREAYDKLWPTD